MFDDRVIQLAVTRARNRERDGGDDPAYAALVRDALSVKSKIVVGEGEAGADGAAAGGDAAAAGGADDAAAGAPAARDASAAGPSGDGSPSRRTPAEAAAAPPSAERAAAAAAGGDGGDEPMPGPGDDNTGGGEGAGGDGATKRRRNTAVRVKRLTAEEEAKVALEASKCAAAAGASVARHMPQTSEWRIVTHQVCVCVCVCLWAPPRPAFSG